jgi:hypothetical protein
MVLRIIIPEIGGLYLTIAIGYNPSTGAVQYNASTGAVCEGCCSSVVPIEGCDCSFCSSDQRESYEVTISGYDACADETWGDQTRTGAFSPNGTHVLDLVTECVYSKEIPCSVEVYNSSTEIRVYYNLWRLILTIDSGAMELEIELEQSDYCDPDGDCCSEGLGTSVCNIWGNDIWQGLADVTIAGTCDTPGTGGSLTIYNDNCTNGLPTVFNISIFKESAGGGNVDFGIGDARVCEDVV